MPHLLRDWSLSCSARFNDAAAQIQMARAADRTEEKEKYLQAARDILNELKQDLDAQIKDPGGSLKQSFEKFQAAFMTPKPGTNIVVACTLGKELYGRDSSILSAYSRLVQFRLKELDR